MDNSNLIGPIPHTSGSVYAKELKQRAPVVRGDNILLRLWWMIWGGGYQGCAFSSIFSLAIVAELYSSGTPFVVCTVLGLFVAYVEIMTLLLLYGANPFEKIRSLFFRPPPIPSYHEAVEALKNSENETERNSVMLGTVYGTPMPVLIDRELHSKHVHITGPSGNSKSFGVLYPLIFQLLHRALVIVIDLGGDDAAMHLCRKKAERAGVPFWLSTSDPTKPSHVCNHFDQSHIASEREAALVAIQGTGADTGSVHPDRKYFESRMRELGLREMEVFRQKSFRGLVRSIRALDGRALRKALKLTTRQIEHGEALNVQFAKLAEIPSLNGTSDIDFAHLIAGGPATVFFHLPAMLDKSTSVSMFNLVMFSLSNALMKARKDHLPVILAIDEAQEGLSSVVTPYYKSIRKHGCSIWTCHQDFQDLVNADRNLLSTVVNNSAVGIHLGARDSISRKHLTDMAGKVRGTKTMTNANGEQSVTEEWQDRILTTDFDFVNNTPDAAFVTMGSQAGFSAFNHPFICKLLGYATTREEYEALRLMPWPDMPTVEPECEPAPVPGPTRDDGASFIAAVAAIESMFAVECDPTQLRQK